MNRGIRSIYVKSLRSQTEAMSPTRSSLDPARYRHRDLVVSFDSHRSIGDVQLFLDSWSTALFWSISYSAAAHLFTKQLICR
jgi:hypothetical protein